MEQRPGRTIFLAEDDIDDQELLIEALLHIDGSLQIHVEDTGEKAVAYLQQLSPKQTPTLIILDYNLPKVNGQQILSLLKQEDRFNAVNKIVWSTSNSPQYEQRCLEAGAHAYLVKPADISGIARIARTMLEFC